MAKRHMALLSSDHINYMVFRYLQEAGFTHTAFSFAHESGVTAAPVDPNNVAPGTLIALIQKGMQYLELEANVEGQDGAVDGDFKMLTPEELITHDPDQLRQLVQERKEEERAGGSGAGAAAAQRGGGDNKRQRGLVRGGSGKEQKEKQEQSKSRAERAASQQQAARGPAPMEEDAAPGPQEVSPSDVIALLGHESEVYMSAWSPTELLLASGRGAASVVVTSGGERRRRRWKSWRSRRMCTHKQMSGDGTTRIWNLNPGPNYCKSTVLLHEAKSESKPRDVTTIDWNKDGTLLATGSYDGLARIWTKEGKLKQTLDKHVGPVFALKWNRRGDMLLSGSVDKKIIVWDAKAGEVKQVFDHHEAAALDVDWKNNNSFASCSTDLMIHVCRVGETQPLKTFSGHKNEVNACKWDPSGTYLASCSDDTTAKIWSMKSDSCIHDLREHKKEVYTIRWSPTGQGSANPHLPLLLATASFDATVKLWEVEQGRCVQTLRGHTESVYSVAFSPNGRYLATGSFDKNILIWSVADGSLIRTCRGEAGIYDVSWNETGDKVAACFANRNVCVVDLRL